MASEGCVESGLPKNCDKALKKSKFFDRKRKNDRNHGKKKKPVCFSNAKLWIITQFQGFLKSKAPLYLLLAVYLVICLLGNVVTGIILIKHHFASHEEMEGMNNLTQDIFAQIESRNNETTTMTVDSELDFDISQMEAEDSLDEQLLYLNISNITVGKFFGLVFILEFL